MCVCVYGGGGGTLAVLCCYANSGVASMQSLRTHKFLTQQQLTGLPSTVRLTLWIFLF